MAWPRTERALDHLTDPLLAEQFGHPTPNRPAADVEAENLAEANSATYEDRLLRRKPRQPDPSPPALP